MKTRFYILIAATFILTGLFAPSAFGQGNKARLASETKITMAQARQAALARVTGNIEEGRLEREKGKLWYEFEIHRDGTGVETVIHIDAVSGELGVVEAKGGGSSEKENEIFAQTEVSWDDAERTARSRMAGSVVFAKLERERGKLLYEFEVITPDGKEGMIHVDAVRGEVESTRKK